MNRTAFQRIGAATSLLALFFMLGGHWLALQSVAWTQMIATFAQTETFSRAVEKTFDGEHPCRMCLGIREGKQQEDRQERAAPLLKERHQDLFCEARRINVPPAPNAFRHAPGFVPTFTTEFIEAPPIPPPRPVLS